MKIFKQLPLDGNINDQCKTQKQVENFKELELAIGKFYHTNREYNPRQLHYLIEMISLDDHLDALINWDENDMQE